MKRLLAFLVSLSIVLSCMSGITLVAFADGLSGAGVEGDPYLITSAADFALIANDLTAYYKQTADITGVTAMISDTFSGVYDGDGHSIDVTISATDEGNVGLFAKLTGTVKNLTVTGSISATTTSNIYVGGIVSAMIQGTSTAYSSPKIINCVNYATVTLEDASDATSGNTQVAGIVGRAYGNYMENGEITGCINYGTVSVSSTGTTTRDRYVAGIVGVIGEAVSVTNCANFGSVTGKKVAGISPWIYTGISGCYNFGTITSTANYASGIAATPAGADFNIENCFNAGQVSGGNYNAAIFVMTYADRNINITNCYNVTDGLAVTDASSTSAVFTVTNTHNVSTVEGELEKVTVTDSETLKTTKLSDAYTLASENTSNSNYNATYQYPQLVNNLVPADTGSYMFGSGTEADPYIIRTAQQFNSVFGNGNTAAVNLNNGSVYHIVNDIDLTTLDGGYTPYNLTYDYFAGEIHGADLNGNKVQRTINFGAIGSAEAPFTGVVNDAGTISMAGAIAGRIGNGKISYLTLEGSLYSDAISGIGAVTGYIDGAVTISNIINNMDVTGPIKVGGIAGTNNNASAKIEYCTNNGDITSTQAERTSSAVFAAGIIAYTAANKPIDVSYCTNNGVITANVAGTTANSTGRAEARIGGIAGLASHISSITYCVNNGSVRAANNYTVSVGGIVGYLWSSRAAYCANNGDVCGGIRVGGIVGVERIDVTTALDGSLYGVHNSYNAGRVEATSSYAAGIVGFSWYNPTESTSAIYTNNFNTGEITNASATTTASLANVYGNSTSATAEVGISGFYDTTGIDIATIRSGYTAPSVTSAYVLNGSGLTYGATITEDALKALTTTDDVFGNSEVWTMDTSNGYNYPQLVGNIYVVTIDATPTDLEIVYEAGTYSLTWEGLGEVTKYEVYVGGSKVGETTNKYYDVTSNVANTQASNIYVVAVTANGSKQSAVIESFNGLFAGGSGIDGDPYKVATAAQFMQIENYSDKYFIQIDDFTVTDYLFKNADTSIVLTTDEKAAAQFTGVYDGNSKTITLNITVGEEQTNAVALFAMLNGTVKNLITDGAVTVNAAITSKNYGVTAVAGYITGENAKVLNCTNYADITSTAEAYASGIVGRGYKSGLVIDGCKNYGNITSRTPAGIVSVTNTSTTVKNCANFGTITGNTRAAGIVDNSYGGTEGCYNLGTIIATGASGYASGIAGLQYVSFTDNDEVGVWDTKDKVNNMEGVEHINCFNAGTLVGNTTVGITARAARVGAVNIINCYNAVTADYPIVDWTDVELAEVNATAAEIKGDTWVDLAITDCYYLTADTSTDDDSLTGSTPLDKAGLKAAEISGYTVSGDYLYPQLSANPIPEADDDVDFALVSISGATANGTTISYKDFDYTAPFYVQQGYGVKVNVTPATGYQANVTVNSADYETAIVESKTVSVLAGADEVVIAVTDEELQAQIPDEVIAGEGIVVNGDSITIDDVEYTRYAIAAGRANKGVAVEMAEFGVLINTADAENNDSFEYTTAKQIAKADATKISEAGWYGILIHGKQMEAGTYYVRPYVIYKDKDGTEYYRYGAIQSFEIPEETTVVE